MMRRRVVITGASGNVGTALLRRLGETGYEVHAITRGQPPPAGVRRAARWHLLDLADPKAVTHLQRLFNKALCVVHLAWAYQPSHNARYLDAVGVGGSSAVLLAAHAADVSHLVYLSSAATYAPHPGEMVDESWPTTGIPTSAFSRAKSAVEALLDDYDRKGDGVPITRMRPGFIIQRDAGASIRRNVLPPYVDPRWLRLLPVFGCDPSLQLPVIHADDVADACAKAIERRVFGAYNLSAEPPVGRDDIARLLRAIPISVPLRLIRPIVHASWWAHLQPLDPGWLDVAFSMPLLDTQRARAALDWCPQRSSSEALADLAEGLLGEGNRDSFLSTRLLRGADWREFLG